MSEDYIRKTVWHGEIPVTFSLATEDLASIVIEPEPCSIMVPRNSYFPLHMEKIRQYFIGYIKPDFKEAQMWLESCGKIMKWHLPVGVTFDLLFGLEGQGLPWTIIVHFSNYPEKVLWNCRTVDSIRSSFMSTVKEADSLKHGSSIINSMKKPQHEMLWNGLVTKSYDEFWTINRLLMQFEGDHAYRYLPIRIYTEDGPFVQKQIPLYRHNDVSKETTVGDVFLACGISLESRRIITQGIEIPLSASALWVTRALSYPDNFVHLCAVLSNSTSQSL